MHLRKKKSFLNMEYGNHIYPKNKCSLMDSGRSVAYKTSEKLSRSKNKISLRNLTFPLIKSMRCALIPSAKSREYSDVTDVNLETTFFKFLFYIIMSPYCALYYCKILSESQLS